MNIDYDANQPTTDVPGTTQSTDESVDDVISTLNGLITTCKDGQEGFKEAAEGVERSDLKTEFYQLSQQRSEFAGVLQGLVRSLGGDPEKSGSFSGALHRGWMDIKAAVMGKDEEAILNECERGEDSAKNAYAEALKLTLPANVNTVVSQQSQAIRAAHDKIKTLRDAESSRSAASGS